MALTQEQIDALIDEYIRSRIAADDIVSVREFAKMSVANKTATIKTYLQAKKTALQQQKAGNTSAIVKADTEIALIDDYLAS